MNNKNLIILGCVALALGGAAYLTNGHGKAKTPALNGKKVVAAFDVADVASVAIGDKVRLVAGDAGWTIPSLQDYPADRAKIAANLLKLQDLTVGQVARGRELGAKTEVAVKDAAGKTLASLTLGDRHEKWGHGRYAAFNGTTVLVADTLDAFGDDPKAWCDTKIVDTPYVNFKELADPALSEEELGFATGVVAKVTIAGDTNRVATVGNVVKGGSDRYLKLDGVKWTFVVPSYSVDSLLPKPEPKEESSAAAKVVNAEEPVAVAAEPVADAAESATPSSVEVAEVVVPAAEVVVPAVGEAVKAEESTADPTK